MRKPRSWTKVIPLLVIHKLISMINSVWAEKRLGRNQLRGLIVMDTYWLNYHLKRKSFSTPHLL